MAARLTDKQKMKIVADYLECQSYCAVARMNGVTHQTVKRVVEDSSDFSEKLRQKRAEDAADIFAYMESKRGMICEIIEKGLIALNSPDKLAEATPAQITTALGTLIDKWALQGKALSGNLNMEDDPITKTLKEEMKNGPVR